MKRQIRAVGRRTIGLLAPTAMESIIDVPALRQQVRELSAEVEQARRRIAALEEEVQEARRLNRRVAEVTDLFQEVLLPATKRDEERVQQLLEQYAKSF